MGELHEVHIEGHLIVTLHPSGPGTYEARIRLENTSSVRIGIGSTPAKAIEDALFVTDRKD